MASFVTGKNPTVTERHRDAQLLSRHGVRLFNPTTQAWLHTSGEGEVSDPFWSWSGFRYQAKALKDRAEARGEDWPYEIVDLEFAVAV